MKRGPNRPAGPYAGKAPNMQGDGARQARGSNAPHPNGSPPRPLNVDPGKHPKKHSAQHISHGELEVGGEGGLGPMPPRHHGQPTMSPHKK